MASAGTEKAEGGGEVELVPVPPFAMPAPPGPGPVPKQRSLLMSRFVAAEKGAGGPVVGESTNFPVGPEDRESLKTGAIEETPERRQALRGLIDELTGKGWQPSGFGQHWYSYRFRRRVSPDVPEAR